ncbi:ATP-binding protein [Halalkalibacter nanhaiisediminis]|nr:ATP-binding protein [Halalkalibacter nanhaiisediminis]
MDILFNDLQTFLLNILLVFSFFFIYLRYVERKVHRLANEFLITLIAGISIILCLSFTINLQNGHMFDLRQVPFIVGALYGGRRVAVILFIILTVYRFYLDGAGFYGSLAVHSLLLVSLWFIIPSFNRTSILKKRVVLAIITSSLGVLIMVLVIILFFPKLVNLQYFLFFSIFLIVQSIGTVLIVHFIEKERSNTALAKELRRLEKLKTVSEIAASISHEVRNPLTVTKGFIQLMRDPDLTEKQKELYINFSLEELDRAERTITDYLTFAKPSLHNIEILDVNKEIDYIIKVVNPFALLNNVHIDVQKDDDLSIVGEGEKLHQCLINIIKNGIESMPEGGKMSIHLKEKNGKAAISIRDTGVGMNEEQIERLGTPFYTTKDKGTGLGTMVVYSIIKAMRGDIKVESEVGKGTCFILSFPLAVEND